MKNSELSRIIKSVREEKGLKIEMLSISTKIPTKYIEALENEEYDSLPSGPYAKLYFNQILKELKVDVNNISPISKKANAASIKKESVEQASLNLINKKPLETPIEVDESDAVTETSGEGNMKGLFLFLFLIACGVGAYVYFEKIGYNSGPVSLTDKERADSILVADSIETVKRVQFVKDSLRNIEIEDSLKVAEELLKREFVEKNSDNRKQERKFGWNNPAYKEVLDSELQKKYSDSTNPVIKIKATEGYVKVKLLSKKNRWWKRIDYKDSLVINMPESSSLNIYNCDKSEVTYKNEPVDFKKYKYVKYLFVKSKSYILQKAYY